MDNDYSDDLKTKIKWLYIASAIIWIFLVIYLNLFAELDIIILFLIVFPLIIFWLNYVNVDYIATDLEEEMFQGNYLQFGTLIILIVINWNTPSCENESKLKFFRLLVVAFILIMLSLVDVWAVGENQSIIKHGRSALETAALTILSLTLYLYYKCIVDGESKCDNKTKMGKRRKGLIFGNDMEDYNDEIMASTNMVNGR